MGRSFAVGDIHGCYRTFQKMVLEKLHIRKWDTLYCLGDYIDRGPDSKGVIDFIVDLRKSGYRLHTIRGNHEQMMLGARSDEMMRHLWIRNGGDATLKSFGTAELNAVDPGYFTFMEETQYFIQTKQFIFVHAGLNFGREDILEDEEAMLWERGFNPLQPLLGDRLLFHGHTPKPIDYILNQSGNCYNLDGGCVYTRHANLGKLVAINLDNMEFLVVDNCE